MSTAQCGKPGVCLLLSSRLMKTFCCTLCENSDFTALWFYHHCSYRHCTLFLLDCKVQKTHRQCLLGVDVNMQWNRKDIDIFPPHIQGLE